MAQEACAIVGQIRFEEQQTVWTGDVEEQLAEEQNRDIYPGMMFTLAKKRMEKTKLWQIMRKMPKGALLHCHLEAMVDQDWLFREALAEEGLCISAPSPMTTAKSRDTALFRFQYRASIPEAETPMWADDYASDTAIPLTAAADSFPDGGREDFIKMLVSRCSISLDESIVHHRGPNQIWAKFTSCFQVLNTLVYYEPIYRKFLQRMFRQLADDNVQYVELRAAFNWKYFRTGSETPMDTQEGYIEAIRVLGEEVEKFKATEEGKDFWGARMIWTSLRFFDNRMICESEYQHRLQQHQVDLLASFESTDTTQT